MRGKVFQLHTTLASSFGKTSMGLLNVWPSYTASIYSSNETTPLSEPMTTAEESLLGSLPSLGAMLGTVIVGVTIDRLGRRNGGVVLSLPYLISWAMISVTTSKTVVLAARFLGGVAGGAFLVYAPIFISEVAEDSFRGTLTSGPILMYCIGALFSYIFGWILSYRTIIWLNLAFSVALTLLLLSVKESPVFFLKLKRDEEACGSIAHYRGVPPSSKLVLDELSKMKQQLMPLLELISVTSDEEREDPKVEEAEQEKLNSKISAAKDQIKMSPIKLLFTSPTSRHAFVVVITVISMQVLMGIIPVQVFAKKVFTQADPERADLYTVVFALVLTCGCMVPTTIADIVGRRVNEEREDPKVEEAEQEKLNSKISAAKDQIKMSPIKLLFTSPTSRHAFVVVITVISMQVLMGIIPVQVFAKKVFTQADPERADLYTVVFALVLTCGCMVPTTIADIVGRRVLIITASTLVCFCMASLGYFLQSGIAPPWVTVLFILLYCFSFTAGPGSVPYILLAEVFTSDVQNIALMMILEWVWFLNFAILGVYPFLSNLIGIHGTFYFFALMAITNAIISFFVVPETKGLSKNQIQELFIGRKKN